MTRLAGDPQAELPLPDVGRRASSRWSELRPRALSALVLMAAALLTAVAGGPLFAAFWCLAATGVLWEWLRLIDGSHRVASFTLAFLLLVGAAALASIGHTGWSLGLLCVGSAAVAAIAGTGCRSMSAAGLLYAGALVLATAVLRQSALYGEEAIFFVFAVVWGTDCMAYFGGRLIGGPKLSPRFSPSKTWSGFLVGIGSGALLGWAVAPALGFSACILLLGLVMGAVAQGGDVLESIIKRRFHVKDSGSLIPGHGGLMDRLDGFIAASVLAAVLGACRAGADAAGTGLFQW